MLMPNQPNNQKPMADTSRIKKAIEIDFLLSLLRENLNASNGIRLTMRYEQNTIRPYQNH